MKRTIKAMIALWLATFLVSIPTHIHQPTETDTPITKVSINTALLQPMPMLDTQPVQAIEAVVIVPEPAPVQTSTQTQNTTISPVYASHNDLMAAAGIVPGDYTAVDYIISHESSWNPDATEPTTQAHGLPQALPYDKTGCGWVDAVCQLRWASSYALQRYGSWQAAYNFWVVNKYW